MISKMSSCYEAQAGDDGGAWLVPTLALAELHLICMCSTLTLQHRDREMRNAISSRADQSAFMTLGLRLTFSVKSGSNTRQTDWSDSGDSNGLKAKFGFSAQGWPSPLARVLYRPQVGALDLPQCRLRPEPCPSLAPHIHSARRLIPPEGATRCTNVNYDCYELLMYTAPAEIDEIHFWIVIIWCFDMLWHGSRLVKIGIEGQDASDMFHFGNCRNSTNINASNIMTPLSGRGSGRPAACQVIVSLANFPMAAAQAVLFAALWPGRCTACCSDLSWPAPLIDF